MFSWQTCRVKGVIGSDIIWCAKNVWVVFDEIWLNYAYMMMELQLILLYVQLWWRLWQLTSSHLVSLMTQSSLTFLNPKRDSKYAQMPLQLPLHKLDKWSVKSVLLFLLDIACVKQKPVCICSAAGQHQWLLLQTHVAAVTLSAPPT